MNKTNSFVFLGCVQDPVPPEHFKNDFLRGIP